MNSPEYLIAVLAVIRLGAVVTTASPMYTKDDLTKQLADCGARVLFTQAALAPTWGDALEGSGVEHVITFDAAEGDAAGARKTLAVLRPRREPRHSAERRDRTRTT